MKLLAFSVFGVALAQFQDKHYNSTHQRAGPGLRNTCTPYCTAYPDDCADVYQNRPNTNAGAFLPYGVANGDTVGCNPVNSHTHCKFGPFNFPGGVPFFGNDYNDIYITWNGLLSFGSAHMQLTNIPFPTTGAPIIAGFWTDLDTTQGGEMDHRMLSAEDLQSVSYMVQEASPTAQCDCAKNFVADTGFVVTWSNVGYYASQSDRRNTFQIILLVGGEGTQRQSYAIMHYGDIEFYSTVYDGAEACTGEGGVVALAGFNDGTGNYYAHPASVDGNGAQMMDIEKGSNTSPAVRGRYIYKISGGSIGDDPCDDCTDPPPPPPPKPSTEPPTECDYTGAVDLTETCMGDPTLIGGIEDYACWCGKAADPMNFVFKGTPLSDLDSACRRLARCQRCTMCNPPDTYCATKSGTYATGYEIDCSDNADDCTRMHCECYAEFALEAASWLAMNTMAQDDMNVDQQDCVLMQGNGGNCDGNLPWWVPPVECEAIAGDVTDAEPSAWSMGPGDIMVRHCPSCQYDSHKYIVYKRLTDGGTIDFEDLFWNNWFSLPAGGSNILGKDFELFGTWEDAVMDDCAGRNQWQYCNYNDPTVGFPRDCGPFGYVPWTWNARNANRQHNTDAEYYLYKNYECNTAEPLTTNCN